VANEHARAACTRNFNCWTDKRNIKKNRNAEKVRRLREQNGLAVANITVFYRVKISNDRPIIQKNRSDFLDNDHYDIVIADDNYGFIHNICDR